MHTLVIICKFIQFIDVSEELIVGVAYRKRMRCRIFYVVDRKLCEAINIYKQKPQLNEKNELESVVKYIMH